jgi:hypothetical protein
MLLLRASEQAAPEPIAGRDEDIEGVCACGALEMRDQHQAADTRIADLQGFEALRRIVLLPRGTAELRETHVTDSHDIRG